MGQRLFSSISNSILARGLFYLSLKDDAFCAFVYASPAQLYKIFFWFNEGNGSYEFGIGSLNRSGDYVSTGSRFLVHEAGTKRAFECFLTS